MSGVGIVMERAVEIPMRDGMILRAEIYRPAVPGPVPAILTRTPYDRTQPMNLGIGPDALRATAAGYALVVQDVRGRWGSDGDFIPFVHEAADGYDTVEWVAGQPWCDGNVGMIGGSYVGYTQWTAAAQRPPHLRAIAPVVATSDLHDFWIYEGGAPSLWFNVSWLASLGLDAVTKRFPGETWRVEALVKAMDTLGDHLPPVPGMTPAVFEMVGIGDLYRTWVEHPERDAWWRGLSVRESHAAIEVPSLSIGGWYDCFIGGTLANHAGMTAGGGSAAARSGTRLVVGPWRHAYPLLADPAGDAAFGIASSAAGIDLSAMILRFFDRWVKGIETVAPEAPVKLFVMGTNVWRDEEAWPLARAIPTELFLRSGGRANTLWGDGVLSEDPPVAGELADTFVSDPSDPVPTRGGNLCCLQLVQDPGAFDQSEVEERDDVLVYETEPMDEDVEVTGPVTLSVWVSSTAPDFDVTAKLIDAFPDDGIARNLCEGITRARYRKGTDRAELVPVGEPVEIVVDLLGTANVFREGHRIRLEVAAANWPRFDRNPQTGGAIAGAAELRAARQTIHHDAAHPSRLRLPIIPG